MTRALFLGSGGRVGRFLQAAWSGPVTPIWHHRADFDIQTDSVALRDAIADCDVIVNLAGATHHSRTDIADANTKLARCILDQAGDTPVFLVSSAAVYGTQSGILSETTPPEPVSPYGHDKAAMEDMARAHTAGSIVLRIGNIAGADALLGVDRDCYDLDVFADGSHPQRSYISPVQLAHVLSDLIVAHATLPPLLNIATSRTVSMADLLSAAGKTWRERPAGPDAITKVELDTTLLQHFSVLPPDASDAATIVSDLTSLKGAA